MSYIDSSFYIELKVNILFHNENDFSKTSFLPSQQQQQQQQHQQQRSSLSSSSSSQLRHRYPNETEEEYYKYHNIFKSSLPIQIFGRILSEHVSFLDNNSKYMEFYLLNKKNKRLPNDHYEKLYYVNEKLINSDGFFKILLFLRLFTDDYEIKMNQRFILPKRYITWYFLENFPSLNTLMESLIDVQSVSLQIIPYKNNYSSIKFSVIIERIPIE